MSLTLPDVYAKYYLTPEKICCPAYTYNLNNECIPLTNSGCI